MSRSEALRQRASWVLLVALVATAVTVVFVASNVEAQSTGTIDEELCTKIEGGQLGVNDTYPVGATTETVSFFDWVWGGTDYRGVSWSATHPVSVWVKFSTDTQHQEGTSGTFSNLPHGISNIVVCLGTYESQKIGSD